MEEMIESSGLEEQLNEAGTKLQDPPTSVDELLCWLNHAESLLSRVPQASPISMIEAISPLTRALVLDVLLRHPNVDVRVAVASCISEITRITAPDAPYDDEEMKDVFHQIVSSLEGLSDKSSRSYDKRVNILRILANVKSFLVMLDLNCDDLIVVMFKIFHENIRDCNAECVFSSMEKIMVLVIDESDDDISSLLACLEKAAANQERSVAVKLAEKVFEKCASKLKPYLTIDLK